MKIVFDSKEEERTFFTKIPDCPSDIGMGFKDIDGCIYQPITPARCTRCWEQSGLLIEVKEENNV